MTTQSQTTNHVVWKRRVRVRGVDTFRIGQLGERLVAEWPGVARLTCLADGSDPCILPQRGAAHAQLTKLRRGPIHALLRDLAGELALHASAVAFDGKAIVLVGPSGAGKSTAAAELCLRHGAQLLADDVASLEVREGAVRVLATEEHHHLDGTSRRILRVGGGSREGKLPLRARRRGIPDSTVHVIALLRFDNRRGTSTVRPLRGPAAVRALLPAIVRFDTNLSRKRELDQLLFLFQACKVVEVARPRNIERPILLGSILREIFVDG